MKLTVRVPATVANLGPGFDSFGLALALHNEITIDTDAEPSVHVEGEGADELPTDESNLVLRAMRTLADAVKLELPTPALRCHNRIPLARGLGSSAAAVVGGLVLANRLLGSAAQPNELLRIAVELEGHADNAGAAFHGGVTIAYLAGARWLVERLEPADALRPVALVPDGQRVGTEDARRALPNQVDRTDATFNASRAALLALALTTRPDLLPVALEDRLHQERRLDLAHASRELFRRLREEDTPVCVAGSGPSLLAFDTDGHRVTDPGPGWRVLRPGVDPSGAGVLEGS